MGHDPVVLSLAGDVMTGRGIDQVLGQPGDARLQERTGASARTYVELAEAVNGPIPAPVEQAWPWGDALSVLDEADPDVRVINLETSVTRSDDFEPGKAVHYRMHPANVDCVTAGRPDACVLANNHTLDFGVRGLRETLTTLAGAGLEVAGAGHDAVDAHRPAVVHSKGPRVLIWSVATETSGTPTSWAPSAERPGVAVLPDESPATAADLGAQVRQHKGPGDLAVVSIHWGSNWGYRVPHAQVRFAHRLVDAGVDVVYGHSSHHPRPVEIYRDRLILYGCGDLINDYEGIGGNERYRDDLRLLYLVTLDAARGELEHLRMVPLQARRFRLEHATPADADWLRKTMADISPTLRTNGNYWSLKPRKVSTRAED